jgi:hypothetical protein
VAGGNAGLILRCEVCGTKNYLDPYAFFNFSGMTKCAKCDQVYAITLRAGFVTSGPDRTDGKPDRLPGYAETPDFEPITGARKTADSPKAQAQIVGKPKPISQSIRGKPTSGRPLSKDELVGSRARFVVEG